mmetsp:Transcript_5519/g.10679  ORF Transcript_5519/g.10679 Transcript_5519/m.10679 type:complete len:445 (+) Transcript_5519:193-1527(+)
MLPLSFLMVAALFFLLGTPRYNTTQPHPKSQPRTNSSSGNSLKKGLPWLCGGGGRSNGGSKSKNTIAKRNGAGGAKETTLFDIFRISMLVVPFNVGYNQMPTTFVVQGSVMAKAFGIFDVASMNSLDPLSVLVFGSITANTIYPYLARRGIKLATTHKFAIGSCLGACAVAWAILVEHKIHSTFERTGEHVNVLWQAPSYVLIGFGEIFAVSTAYEMAFTCSPPDKKVLSSATNIFCVGGLPNMICIVLVRSCSQWFTNSRGDENIGRLEDYATAHVGNYFVVLFTIMVFGAILNVVPCIKEYAESIEERALDFMKTPTMARKPKHQRYQTEQKTRDDKNNNNGDEESSPLLATATATATPPQTKKYQQYLKDYGSGPIYTRSSSMRAGPSLGRRDLPGSKVKKIKYKTISKLYAGKNERGTKLNLATGADGKPIKVGAARELV